MSVRFSITRTVSYVSVVLFFVAILRFWRIQFYIAVAILCQFRSVLASDLPFQRFQPLFFWGLFQMLVVILDFSNLLKS